MKKLVLITGASKGIGKLLLIEFIERGYKVSGTYNSSLPEEKYKKSYSKVDITNSVQVAKWIACNAESSKEIILINCAGIAYNALAHKSDINCWRDVIEVNLIGTFNAISNTLPYMRENKYGRIINFSSVVGQKGVAGTSSYAASKSGLWGMTRAIAIENATKNITINNINLGYMNIGMIEIVPENILEIIKDSIPLKTLGSPVEIKKAVNYLIDSDYITGTSIDINGGIF